MPAQANSAHTTLVKHKATTTTHTRKLAGSNSAGVQANITSRIVNAAAGPLGTKAIEGGAQVVSKGSWDAYGTEEGWVGWSGEQPDWSQGSASNNDQNVGSSVDGVAGDAEGLTNSEEDGDEGDDVEDRRPGAGVAGTSETGAGAFCPPVTMCEDRRNGCGQEYGG